MQQHLHPTLDAGIGRKPLSRRLSGSPGSGPSAAVGDGPQAGGHREKEDTVPTTQPIGRNSTGSEEIKRRNLPGSDRCRSRSRG